MTVQLRRKFVWLIPVFIIGIVFLVFSVQAQDEPPVLAVYLNPDGTGVFDNGSVLDFGEAWVGTPVSRTLHVANLGSTDITVSVGDMVPGFSRSANSLSIGAGNNRSLIIQCNATTVGNYSVSTYLDIVDGDQVPEFTFTISCTVREPIAVYLNPDGTGVFDNGSVLDFGETVVGTPVSRTLRVANLGSTDITVSVGDMVPGFSRSANSLSIGAGNNRSLIIQCNATTVGNYSVSTYLDIVDGDQVPEFTFTVSCTVTRPRMAIYAPDGTTLIPEGGTYNFGTTLRGTPLDATFTIVNEGTGTLTSRGATVGNFERVLGSFNPNLPLGPGQSTTFTLRCPADTAGTLNGFISIDLVNDPALGVDEDYDINLSCTVSDPVPRMAIYAPDGTFIPEGGTYNFGTTPFSTPLDATFTIVNEGTGTLTSRGATIGNFERVPGSFNPNLPLDPGQSTTFALRCPADTAGTLNGFISIDLVNDPALGVDEDYDINLSCTVNPPAPEMAVYAPGGTEILNGGSYDFGTTPFSTPLEATFTIANEGTATLNWTGMVIMEFEVVPPFNSSGSLQAGENTTFTLRCPAAAGNHTGSVTIQGVNSLSGGSFSFSVSCTVSDPVAHMAIYVGSTLIPEGATYDFGTTPFGTPLRVTFTMVNEGTASLTYTALAISNSRFNFGQVDIDPLLLPGEIDTFEVLCRANAVGTHTASVSVIRVDRDPDLADGQYDFDISCTVTPSVPDIALYDGATPVLVGNTVDLGTTTSGTPISRSFTIANEGTDTLNLGTISVPAGFTVTTAPAASVSASTSTSFDVQCDASGEGSFSGTVSIPSDDPDENPYEFTVSCVVDTQPVTPTDTPVITPTTAPTDVASFPTPPATNTCKDHNFVTNGGVRAGVPGELSGQVFCRVLVQDGNYTSYLGYDLTSASNIGNPALVELGIQQAVDIFSPTGPNYYTGGIVICLRGEGHLIYLNANRAPRIAEIVGSYTVPEFPGFTCITLFEPGTLLLVRSLPE